MNQPTNLPSTGPARAGDVYRTTDNRHLAAHYGIDRTSIQLAAELGRTPAAVRKHVSRHPDLRPPKAP